MHIPFCEAKCAYCDFASYPGKAHLFAPYVEALVSEICAASPRVATVYVGGGTPNLLPPEMLTRLLALFPGAGEVTVEANPAMGGFSSIPANRLSLGVQSLLDSELAALGRLHTADEALSAYAAARKSFGNISLDLMYGIPGQTRESWAETLDRVIGLAPEHISLYSLTVEEGTPFWEMQRAGRLELPGDDAEADMYEDAIEALTRAGYAHYEISNFARPGYECRHNLTYWRNEPYFGFGAGAAQYVDGVRAVNTRIVEDYIRNISSGCSVKEDEERLTGRASMGETVFLGLRMMEGVSRERFVLRYGITPEEAFPAEIADLVKRGLLKTDERSIRLTHTGLFLANQVFAEFVG
ncbi:MAG: radical SAM family heme chaperone HemW [Armatimonadota bacterium]